MFNWLFGRKNEKQERKERQAEIDAARKQGFKRKDVQGVPFWELPKREVEDRD